MYISLNWIKDFVDLDPKLDPQEIGDLFTVRTAEIEGFEDLSKAYDGMVVGKIEKIEDHPNADKLKVCTVDIGKEKTQIVCGGTNLYEGMMGPVAMPGSWVKWHGEGDPVQLSTVKLRGVESNGMLCVGEEIGLAPTGDEIVDMTKMDVQPGQSLAEIYGTNDIVIEVDNKSLTHRPDLWGHYGIAREFAAIYGKDLQEFDLSLGFPSKGDQVDIKIEDYDLCPRYCGVIVKNVKVEESPKWLQDRLIAVGYRPISNIVDITNYVMAELGQPLHAFDESFIQGGIVVRRANKGEKITTLDGEERKLDDSMLVIADHKKPIAIAGVMGGENSEIQEGTTEIIIESANFNAQSIRTTSTKLGLRTEAVQRFEKALDPVLAETAIKRTCELILQLCPDAEIAGPINDVNNGLPEEQKVKLDTEMVSSKIGVEISSDECKKILESLQFKVSGKGKTLEVTVPTWRATKDVDIEDDLVEEIVRMYGYENVPETMPELPITSPMPNIERTLKHKARKILAQTYGMSEVYNYSFYGKDELSKCLMPEEKHVLLDNFLSSDQTHLRIALMPNLLKNVADNLRYFEGFRLFEVGRTYVEEGDYFPVEEKWIAGMTVLPKKAKNEIFYEAKAIIEGFLKDFTGQDAEFLLAIEPPPFVHPSRTAKILINGEAVGGVGEIHPQVLKNWDIDAKVAGFEINFTKLAAIGRDFVKYKALPKFPGLDLDISVVIGRDRKVADIQKAINEADSKLIERVKLFDIYEGENIEDNKKALAFRVLLQAKDRTLTDEEMSKVQKKIFANLEKLGGVIRGV
ncbi:phenylalanine--tRNA ligase subunit beta [Patescibacteria group bacterium]